MNSPLDYYRAMELNPDSPALAPAPAMETPVAEAEASEDVVAEVGERCLTKSAVASAVHEAVTDAVQAAVSGVVQAAVAAAVKANVAVDPLEAENRFRQKYLGINTTEGEGILLPPLDVAQTIAPELVEAFATDDAPLVEVPRLLPTETLAEPATEIESEQASESVVESVLEVIEVTNAQDEPTEIEPEPASELVTEPETAVAPEPVAVPFAEPVVASASKSVPQTLTVPETPVAPVSIAEALAEPVTESVTAPAQESAVGYATMPPGKEPEPSLERLLREEKTIQFVGFLVGSQMYAVPSIMIREVIRSQPLSRLPVHTRFVPGVINLRGLVMPLVSLRELLQAGPPQDGQGSQFSIITGTEGLRLGLEVDRIRSMYVIKQEDIVWNVASVLGLDDDTVIGLFELDEKLVPILSVERVANLLLEEGLDLEGFAQ